MAETVTVASVEDLDEGSCLKIEHEGTEIALFNVDGDYHAIGNSCPHSGGSLCDGLVVGRTVSCPLHGSAFDIVSGEVQGPPAREDTPTYPVSIVDGAVRISIEE